MSEESQNAPRFQAAYDALLFTEAKDHQDRLDIDAVTAGLARIVRRRRNATHGSKSADGPAADQDSGRFRYADMSISQAAAEILSAQPAKADLALAEIINKATEGGYTFDGGNPRISARIAMRRRAGSQGDIIQVSRTNWGLREWYTTREITAFQHSERTKAGQEAARAKGKMVGKAWKLNASQAAEFRRLAGEGASNSHLASVFGIAAGTASNYKRKLRNWNPGEPFPPKATNDEDDEAKRSIRLV